MIPLELLQSLFLVPMYPRVHVLHSTVAMDLILILQPTPALRSMRGSLLQIWCALGAELTEVDDLSKHYVAGELGNRLLATMCFLLLLILTLL